MSISTTERVDLLDRSAFVPGEYLTNLELERVLAGALRSLGVDHDWANEHGESYSWPDFVVVVDGREWCLDCKGSPKHWGSLYHDARSLSKDHAYHEEHGLWYVTNDLNVFSFDEMLEGLCEVWNYGREGWSSKPRVERSLSDWLEALHEADQEVT